MERLEDPADNTYGRLNATVILISLAASTGGLLFGYDLGVVGGVESFPAFQAKFFPEISDGNSTSPSWCSPPSLPASPQIAAKSADGACFSPAAQS